nr:condensation domain-containing protein [Bacillus subtilis]
MTKANSIQDIYPLSYMQEGMLFHSLLQKDSQAYVEQASFTIEGKVNPQFFQNSINALVERHDIFRTIFISQNVSSPQQIVLRERNVIVLEEDITHLNEAEQSQFIEQWKEKDRTMGVSFAKGCAHAHRCDSNRREPVLLHLDLSSYHDGRLSASALC